MPEQPSGGAVAEYRSAVASIRDTAKWVIGTLGAIGGVLVTGLGLSSLVDVNEDWRLVLAVSGIAVALVGIAWGIAQTAKVLRPSTVDFAEIVAAEGQNETQRPKFLAGVVSAKTGLLGGLATDFAGLETDANSVMVERNAALEAHYEEPADAEKATKAQAAQAKARLYGLTLEAIVGRAAYDEIASRIKVWKQLTAGGLVAGGVCLFAVMLALPTDPTADLHGADLTDVGLSGTRLVKADFSDMTLTRANLRGADLREADFSNAELEQVDLTGAHTESTKFDGAKWTGTTCPDGTKSDEAGNTCEHHLEAVQPASQKSTTATVSEEATPPDEIHVVFDSSESTREQHSQYLAEYVKLVRYAAANDVRMRATTATGNSVANPRWITSEGNGRDAIAAAKQLIGPGGGGSDLLGALQVAGAGWKPRAAERLVIFFSDGLQHSSELTIAPASLTQTGVRHALVDLRVARAMPSLNKVDVLWVGGGTSNGNIDRRAVLQLQRFWSQVVRIGGGKLIAWDADTGRLTG